ncbi:MAG TPA: hypothetical protein VGJ33_15310 [Candidatus Angelobacter sp.]|jgi:hypothetical protein
MSIQNPAPETTWKLLTEISHNSRLGFATRSVTNTKQSEEALKMWGMIRQVDFGYKITPAGRQILKLKKKSSR